LFLGLALASPFGEAVAQATRAPDTVIVRSGTLSLHALLWRPNGRGPFPAVLFNHGAWPSIPTPEGPRGDSRVHDQAATLGPVFTRHGYALLFLFRRGVGLSSGQGVNGADVMQRALRAEGQEGYNRVQLQLLEGEDLTDAMAALAFLHADPDIDPRRIVVAGHSFGGSLTLILTERDHAIAAAVDFAGAAGTWERSPQLRRRLLATIPRLTAPVFIAHAANDYSVAPGKALAAELERRDKPYRLEIYRAFGATSFEGHNIVYLSVPTWESAVFAFLDERMRR
jgi:carboxymethylenebutenolidase